MVETCLMQRSDNKQFASDWINHLYAHGLMGVAEQTQAGLNFSLKISQQKNMSSTQ